MIVDTSALIAIIFNEPERLTFTRLISDAEPCRMSVASYLEAAIVVGSRSGAASQRDLDSFIADAGVVLEPVTLAQALAAASAWRRFGRGNHRAALNFGDCFAYALSEVTGEPLLCKGDDFPQTDIQIA